MDIFDVLSLIGGLCLFLFGMSIMGNSLERRAGDGLKSLLGRLTQNRAAGFLTGLGVTAVVQSSSATTVMVVGFVNSGVMTLRQAINVIMGANVGTTVTAWILSLGGISSDNVFVQLLKPTSFTPILALIGTVMFMFGKTSKSKDTGSILLGFATLMFGMDTMTAAVSVLRTVPEFQNLFILFTNPVLGVIVGAILTAIIQSSSASVGILQALSSTGAVTYGAAIPIIMGQNIGTCVTAMLSSIGATKNAKRAAVVHLSFNIIGTVIWLVVFSIAKALFVIPLLGESVTHMGIAVAHSAFNILCTLVLLPMSGFLERLANKIVPEPKETVKEQLTELDERLLATPPIALARCNEVVCKMADISVTAIHESMSMLTEYDPDKAKEIRDMEEQVDRYEDILGTYLVKLSRHQTSDADSATITKLLKVIGDYERLSDHSVNVLESVEELREKGIEFSGDARREIEVMTGAVGEIIALALEAFAYNNLEAARKVEPLEQVIDDLKAKLRDAHTSRLTVGECTIEAGFVWADLLTNLERCADHCSNIAACVIDASQQNMNLHESVRSFKNDDAEFERMYMDYLGRYKV